MSAGLKWSEKSYTLTDIDSQLRIGSCIVKIEQGQELQSFLDTFAIKYFKNLFSVQAYKMNNNEDLTDASTYGEEVCIPLNYTKHGSIIPIYGTSHVFKTVEELIMAFPRYVEVQDNLTFCSNNCLIHLKPGDHLELLKVEKTMNTNSNQLVCQRTDDKQKINLTASSIGHFKTVADPNTYSIKDVLKILKLPQFINFGSSSNVVADLEGAEGYISDVEFSGSYLLVGLEKFRGAVVNSLSEENDNDTGYVLPLNSDLFQHLKYHFAFKEESRALRICKFKSDNNTLDQESSDIVKEFTQNSRESATAPVRSQDIYLLPESTRKSSTSGEKIAKKINSTIELVKSKIKKTSPNLAPGSASHISKKFYPSLSKIRLVPETKENIYKDIEEISLEGQSRFFSSAYASVNPDIESDSTAEPGNKSKELGKMGEKSKMHDKLPSISNKEFYGIPPPIPEKNQEYDMSLDGIGCENYQRTSTLKVSNRHSVNSGMTSAQRSKNNKLNGGVKVRSKMVTQNNGAEFDKDNAKDQRKIDGKAVNVRESTLSKDIASSKTSTKDISADCSFDDESNTYDDIREHFVRLSKASPEQTSAPAPNPKQSSTTAFQQNSKPTLVMSKSTPASVQRNNSTPIPVKKSSKTLTKSSSVTDKEQDPMPLPQNDSSPASEGQRPSVPLANRPPMPVPQPPSSTATLPQSATEKTNSSKTLSSTKLGIAKRPPLPIPQPTTPTTQPTTSPTAESPTTKTETATSKSAQQNPKESIENSISDASVKELCMLLESCGLHRVKDICQENYLDGYFLSKLSESSLQSAPFNLSSIEMMKLKMMLEGWRPKLE
ncbi:flocculation protein FLO11-like isoform X2 [Octopus sinensis]|uniref:Flocculation protein FLO11-like isoform X2 n=1 Tax=Octopus sinensis TaxID=2607531 RepID=A0A7E6F0V2_9MOLL|nr:flocculation protein FLO11-like isoform X2 [Octopus sinensis]